MSKSHETKQLILKSALELSSQLGLESISIGVLAKKVGMSKSGLFGHFNSKEKLQMMVLEYAARNFTQEVFLPAFKEARGIPRIMAISENWHKWSTQSFPGGCPFAAASFEFDDRPGAVSDHIKTYLNQVLASIGKSAQIAKDEGHFTKDLDTEAFAYEFYSLLLGHHLYNRLLKNEKAQGMYQKAINDLIEKYQA